MSMSSLSQLCLILWLRFWRVVKALNKMHVVPQKMGSRKRTPMVPLACFDPIARLIPLKDLWKVEDKGANLSHWIWPVNTTSRSLSRLRAFLERRSPFFNEQLTLNLGWIAIDRSDNPDLGGPNQPLTMELIAPSCLVCYVTRMWFVETIMGRYQFDRNAGKTVATHSRVGQAFHYDFSCLR